MKFRDSALVSRIPTSLPANLETLRGVSDLLPSWIRLQKRQMRRLVRFMALTFMAF